MKKIFLLLGLLCLIGWGCSSDVRRVPGTTEEYHFIALAEAVTSAHIGVTYMGDTAKYVGKIQFNPETKQINYKFLDKNAEASFKFLINPFIFKNQRLFYLRYSKTKLTKTKPQDTVGYTDGLWRLYSSAAYGEDDFWEAVNVAGFVENNVDVNADRILRYKMIAPNVGAAYYNHKWLKERKKGELTKAMYLGASDCIEYNGEKYYCKN